MNDDAPTMARGYLDDTENHSVPTDLAWSQENYVEPVARHRISPWLIALVIVCSAGLGTLVVMKGGGNPPAITAPLPSVTPTWSPPQPERPSVPPSTTTVTAPPVTVMQPPTALPGPSPVPPSVTPAQSDDDSFISLLADNGFTIENRAAVIANGHRVCTLLGSMTLVQIVDAIAANEQNHFTWDQANSFASAAKVTYCP